MWHKHLAEKQNKLVISPQELLSLALTIYGLSRFAKIAWEMWWASAKPIWLSGVAKMMVMPDAPVQTNKQWPILFLVPCYQHHAQMW